MDVLRVANLVLAFVLELAALFAAGSWPLSLDLGTPARVLLAVAVVAIFVTLWAVFAAPKAATRLSSAPRAAFEVLWFGAAGILAAAAGHTPFAIALVALALLNRVLLRLWHQQEQDASLA